MDDSLKGTICPNLTQEETDHLDRLISIREIKSIINNLPKQKAPCSEGCTGEFYQLFKKEIVPVIYSLYLERDTEEDRYLLIHSVKPALP